MKRVLGVLAGVVLFAMLAVDLYLRLGPQKGASPPVTPRPSASPTPTVTATATATPEPEETPTEIVESTPTVVQAPPSRPPGRPRVPRKPPTPRPSSSAALMAEAERALAARNYERAAELYEKVLRAEPGNAKAAAGRAQAQAGLPDRRSFVPGETTTLMSGQTSIESNRGTLPEVPPGFEPGGVAVKIAPKVAATIEFEVVPKKVRQGQPYAVKVYLRNHGKKPIKIRELRIASMLNGSRSESIVTPKLKEVPPQLIALLAEVPSVWTGNVSGWSMEITVRSSHDDVYRNHVSWR